MDFSFVESDAGLKRKECGSEGQDKRAAPAGPPRIAIPSFQEVQRSEQRSAAPKLFRPPFQAREDAPGGPSSFQPALGGNALSLLDGSTGPIPRPAGPPGPLLPQPHPQPQFQQQQGPGFQAAAARPGFASSGGMRPSPGPYPPAHPSQPALALQQQQQFQPRPASQGQRPQQPPYRNNSQHQAHGGPSQQAAQQQQQQIPANAIVVNRRQEGNPVLKHIRNVRWQFGDIVPDYMLGKDTAALFISLRYHLLKPDYIHQRIRELQRSFRLRIILCHVDTEDAVEPLAQVTRAAIGNDCTLICAWSNQECARYLETFKSYENKPAEVIQKDVGSDYVSRINAVLTTIRGVNKTDVKTLGDRFGSVSSIFKASAEELQRCPGIGPTKARRLRDTFHEPFRKNITAGSGTPGTAQREGQQMQQAGPQPQQTQQQQQGEMQRQQQRQHGSPPLRQAGIGGESSPGASGASSAGEHRTGNGQSLGAEQAENSEREAENFEYDLEEGEEEEEDWDI